MPSGRTLERLLLALLTVMLVVQTWQLRTARANVAKLAHRVEQLLEQRKLAAEQAGLAEPEARAPFEGFGDAPDDRPLVSRSDDPSEAFQLGEGLPDELPEWVDDVQAAQEAAERRQARRQRRRAPPLPGANVMNRLYDAADAAYAEEGWTDAEYDEVTLVFDDSMELMRMLYLDLKDRHLTIPEAKTEVEALRDDAQDRLVEILGEQRFERLRSRVADRPSP